LGSQLEAMHDPESIAACYADDAEVRDPFGTTRARDEIIE
jgi:hypothetical protein